MKNQLIAVAVGGIILFIWQFISWAAVPVHSEVYGYTPNQDKILECLSQNLSEEGTYMLPGMAPGKSHEEVQADMAKFEGKPWAQVSYHKSMSSAMGSNMLRGLSVDLIAIWLLTLLLSKMNNLSVPTAVQASVSIGLIAYLTIPYLNSIWFEGSTIAHLMDALIPWAIVGAWLGWWLNRR